MDIASGAVAIALSVHSAVHKLRTGSVALAPFESFIPLCGCAAAYAALGLHAYAARKQTHHQKMPRLSRRHLMALLSFVVTLWFYYIPVNLVLPLGDACVGRCRQFVRPSSSWLGVVLDHWMGPADLDDDQWRDFRSNAPVLLVVGALHLLAGICFRRLRPEHRATAAAVAAVAFVTILHGDSSHDTMHSRLRSPRSVSMGDSLPARAGPRVLVPLAFAMLNYKLSSVFAGRSWCAPAVAWALALTLLATKEWMRGQLSFSRVLWRTGAGDIVSRRTAALLDSQLVPRKLPLRIHQPSRLLTFLCTALAHHLKPLRWRTAASHSNARSMTAPGGLVGTRQLARPPAHKLQHRPAPCRSGGRQQCRHSSYQQCR